MLSRCLALERRLLARARAGAQQVRRALPGRHSIATRLVLTLSMLAGLSTSLSLVLHDALSWDLEAAARVRLDGAATAAERLLANYLGDALTRWQALSRTPEFRANLEVANASTLRYLARELGSAERASLVVFQDRKAKPLAVAGDAALENAAREILASQVATRGPRGTQGEKRHCVALRASDQEWADAPRLEFEPCFDLKGRPSATLFGHEGAGYALIRVPLVTRGRPLGELIVGERVPDDLVADWSSIIGATLALDTGGVAAGEFAADVLRLPGLVARVRTSNDAERHALIASRWRMLAAGCFAVSVALLVAVWLGSTLARPIRELRDATLRAGRGDLDVRVDAARPDELGDVARAFNLTLETLRQSRDWLVHLAYNDPLTNVGNRRSFEEELARRLQSETDRSSPLALMIVDLARFKAVNDTLGNLAGDEVLKAAAARIEASVAGLAGEARIGPWRLGGNEFALLLAGGEVEEAAQRILSCVHRPFELSAREILLGVAIGIAPDVGACRSPSEAMRSCDLALRDAKRQGGNCCVVYDRSMDEPVLRRHAMEARLREAVEADALEVVYQPRVAPASGRITGFEALVRWTDSTFGAVPAEEFVRLAEETRIVVPMGERVLRSAVAQLATWRDLLPSRRARVSVNVSQVQLAPSFVDLVKATLAQHELEPSTLELEITETALMQDEGDALEVLAGLRAFGVRIALDDFGSGYSSLGMLQRLPIDVLKMDRAFVRALGGDSDAEATAAAIVALARVYGMEVVAEGVETPEQRDLLAELGCDELQGYLFSPPLDDEDATRALQRGILDGGKTRRRASRR
jgi:diguanylate cyclase (GGDEF)-like protein